MTAHPWTIRRDAPLSQAKALMREHGIRHLPVLDAGKLVGVVSERDIYLLERFKFLGDYLSVDDAMNEDVYIADPSSPTDVIVETMASKKYGSVVVVGRHDAVEGIFTMTDGMRALATTLRAAAT